MEKVMAGGAGNLETRFLQETGFLWDLNLAMSDRDPCFWVK